jgi:N-acyl-L-homoserine lactone synthetase
MDRLKGMLAESPAMIRAHLRRRWTIYGKGEGYLPNHEPPASMEFDRYDKLQTTRHFVIVKTSGSRE